MTEKTRCPDPDYWKVGFDYFYQPDFFEYAKGKCKNENDTAVFERM